jgi:Na+/H+-dicarboxylate symporter
LTHRSYILIGLLTALILGGLIGYYLGDDMHRGIKLKAAYLEAVEKHRALDYELRSGGVPHEQRDGVPSTNGEGLKTFAAEMEEAKLAFEEDSIWYTAYQLFNFSGKLFLNLLKLLVIPLVVSSLIVGIVSLGDIRHMGRMGGRTILYYLVTTSIAVIIGITFVQLISPGTGTGIEESRMVAERIHGKEAAGIVDTILKVFINEEDGARGAIPSNIFGAMAKTNVLGVIVFSLFFGAALTTIGKRGKPIIAIFEGINETILKLVHWVMYLLPLGVIGLIVGRLAEGGGGATIWIELSRIGWYSFTVVSALLVHGLIVLPIILWLFTGRHPLRFASGMAQALLTAFSTASSSATLPTTMECAEDINKVSKRSASFVLPIGATINMDGTALYEAVAVIFIAQIYGVPMDATMLVVIFLTATLAAIGAAGIPEAGLVTMVIVLNATGLPLEGIAILLSIDWLLDRCRTTVNVWGDSIGSAVIDHYEEEEEEEAIRAS